LAASIPSGNELSEVINETNRLTVVSALQDDNSPEQWKTYLDELVGDHSLQLTVNL